MRPVYVVSGGVRKFAKARPDKTFPAIVKEAYDYAIADLGLEHAQFLELVDGSVASYFFDHFTRQLMAGIMVQDYLGLCPKPGHRVEGGGATGGICFQEAWKSVASGDMEVCLAYGFETMSPARHVQDLPLRKGPTTMAEPAFSTRIPETDAGTILFSVPFPTALNAETLAALKAMAPIIVKQPYAIDYIHSYGQDSPFFAGLANGRLLGCMAPQTGYTYAAPRGHDMATGAETDWVDLTQRRARVHACTVCYFGSEAFLAETPYVLALIEFNGADTLFLGRLIGLDPAAPTPDWIGASVGLRFRRNSQFKPTDVYFYPLAEDSQVKSAERLA